MQAARCAHRGAFAPSVLHIARALILVGCLPPLSHGANAAAPQLLQHPRAVNAPHADLQQLPYSRPAASITTPVPGRPGGSVATAFNSIPDFGESAENVAELPDTSTGNQRHYSGPHGHLGGTRALLHGPHTPRSVARCSACTIFACNSRSCNGHCRRQQPGRPRFRLFACTRLTFLDVPPSFGPPPEGIPCDADEDCEGLGGVCEGVCVCGRDSTPRPSRTPCLPDPRGVKAGDVISSAVVLGEVPLGDYEYEPEDAESDGPEVEGPNELEARAVDGPEGTEARAPDDLQARGFDNPEGPDAGGPDTPEAGGPEEPEVSGPSDLDAGGLDEAETGAPDEPDDPEEPDAGGSDELEARGLDESEGPETDGPGESQPGGAVDKEKSEAGGPEEPDAGGVVETKDPDAVEPEEPQEPEEVEAGGPDVMPAPPPAGADGPPPEPVDMRGGAGVGAGRRCWGCWFD